MIWLLACSTPPQDVRPADLPPGVATLTFSGESILIDGTHKADWKALQDTPIEFGSGGIWMSVPETAPWDDVRVLLEQALPKGPVYLSEKGEPGVVGPFQMGSHGKVVATCEPGSVTVAGAHHRVNLEIDADDGQAWVRGSVRFVPEVSEGDTTYAANLLQDSCWRTQPAPTKNTVSIGGASGCLLPLGKGFRGHRSWREELPDTLKALGFTKGVDLGIHATEGVPFGALYSVLAGLDGLGIQPYLRTVRMGSGSGPPMCDAGVRDAAALAAAGKAWYGLP